MGANQTMSMAGLEQQLTDGLDGLDEEVIDQFQTLLPAGEYLPLLMSMRPRLTQPGGPGDYFTHEQVSTWGIDSFLGLPESPHTAYYRTLDTAIDDNAHLFEFVVPMVPPTWNSASRVADHVERLRHSDKPTAVAVSTLDVCQPAMAEGDDYYAHWCLTHFLLDGHHKVQAAAESGRPLRMLSLLCLNASLATAEQVTRIPGLVSQPATHRD